jgi:hypothetical protein
MKKILAILVLVLFGTIGYAQWVGVLPSDIHTDPTYVNAKIGINKVAVSTFDAFNPSGACSFVASRNYASAVDGNIGTYTIRNDASLDRFQMILRKANQGQHELVMTAYSSTYGGFREFSYFNFVTGKWEMRAGVTTAEYKNDGNVLFNNTGAVGVGVTAFGTTSTGNAVKFQVAGAIKCQELEVAVTPWPDHVFQSGYTLRSLDEVETFILNNKHLPDVPSEQEVAQNGVNVGQMNATLLQKIEELTLYMIDLKKENTQLKDRISKLEK